MNETPFVVDRLVIFDRDGAECIVPVLKATYDLDFRVPPQVAPEQAPLREADLYAGEPGESGLLAEGEHGPPKPATDVFLTAHAVPARRGDRSVDVRFRVGARRQLARVYGDRRWLGALGIYWKSRPLPLARMPLTWENTYGGSDTSPRSERHHGALWENPCGKGYRAMRSRIAPRDIPIPNIEDPAQPYRGVRARGARPSAFLPVAPAWSPRLSHAGTYDARWEREYLPLLPPDFDERFHQAAPGGLRGRTRLVGGELCAVSGTRPEGALRFQLPRLEPQAALRFERAGHHVALHLDTVHVDTDSMRLHLLYRSAFRAHGRIDGFESVRFSARGFEATA